MAPAARWEQAWSAALYRPGGFYRRPEGPAGHFRTAAHAAAPALARAVARLARLAGCTAVLDVGAGRGELLTALAGAAPDLALHAVDVVPRPPGLPVRIGWTAADPAGGDPLPAWPERFADDVLVLATELLDVVPCPVLEVDDDGGLREVLVDPAGAERLGGRPRPPDAGWVRHWWPLPPAEPGARVEVGRPRDELWAALAGRVGGGLLLAVDYGHLRDGRPPLGSLAGFAAGRQVPPVPHGRCDLTAEVALDAVAAAAVRAGAGDALLVEQRTALAALLPGGCPAELLDPGGLGGFGWLLQPVGRPLPTGLDLTGTRLGRDGAVSPEASRRG